ncbi:MAG: RNA-binding protein [Chloroflexota bacterium]
MNKKLYVGNLAYNTTEGQLQELFGEAGQVVAVTLISDRETGRSKGFGFVEMASEAAATVAMEKFNGKKVDGRALTVAEARPPEKREPRSGGYGSRW